MEVYNDIDGKLVNLFRVVKEKPEQFLKELDLTLYSRKQHKEWHDSPSADPVRWAAQTFYIFNTCFAGKYNGGWGFERGSTRGRPRSFQNSLKVIRRIHHRLKTVYIDCLDFRDCIKNWDSKETLFYFDPPYYQVTQGYTCDFGVKDHYDLQKIAKNIKGKFLLTYNDHGYIRQWYSQFNLVEAESQLASRGITREAPTSRRGSLKHLIITNYGSKQDVLVFRKVNK